MKRMFGNIAAWSLASLCCIHTLCLPAAADAAEQVVLPSGLTVSQLEVELKDMSADISNDEPSYASAAVAVMQGDSVLLERYYGKIDMDEGIAADENSVYEWGSISKTLIWVSAMQLCEQGLLDLNRDIRDYLPAGFFQRLRYDEPITMLNLMNHNAGWQETSRPNFKRAHIGSLHDELQAIEPPQIHRPNEVAGYSNYGAAVAGYVVECIAGQDFCDYVHAHIFAPLGMTHTALNPDHSDNAWVYEQRQKTHSYDSILGNMVDCGTKLDYIPCYPAGAATGTLRDLMTYAQALMNDDAPLFAHPETQAMMFSASDCYGDTDVPKCAHGFWVEEKAVRIYGHNGATSACQADMEFDLESKTAMVVMVNEAGGNQFLTALPELVFGSLSPDTYGKGAAVASPLSGYYLMSRSQYHGMMRFMAYLSGISIKDVTNGCTVYDLGGGLYQAVNEEYGTAMLFGIRADGTLEQPSMDLMRDDWFLLHLGLVAAYILLGVIAVFLLLIRMKKKKHGTLTPRAGDGCKVVGHIASLVSVVALLVGYTVYVKNNGGIQYGTGLVLGLVQMACVAACAVAIIAAVVQMVQAKKVMPAAIADMVSKGVTIAAILYYEMYWFWGI